MRADGPVSRIDPLCLLLILTAVAMETPPLTPGRAGRVVLS